MMGRIPRTVQSSKKWMSSTGRSRYRKGRNPAVPRNSLPLIPETDGDQGGHARVAFPFGPLAVHRAAFRHGLRCRAYTRHLLDGGLRVDISTRGFSRVPA